MRDDLVPLIADLAREIMEADGEPAGELGPDTRLFGKGGRLDSMGVVSLVVAVEQAIEDEHGVFVALADERALSQTASPYRTIGTLAAYAESVMRNHE